MVWEIKFINISVLLSIFIHFFLFLELVIILSLIEIMNFKGQIDFKISKIDGKKKYLFLFLFFLLLAYWSFYIIKSLNNFFFF